MSEADTPPTANTTLYSPWPDSDLSKTLAGMDVELALSALSERNRRVIEQKYGLIDGEPKSRQQIATQERISAGRVGMVVRQSLGRIATLRAEQLEYFEPATVKTEPLE